MLIDCTFIEIPNLNFVVYKNVYISYIISLYNINNIDSIDIRIL